MADHIDQIARDDILGKVGIAPQTPGAIDFKDHLLIDEEVQQGGHEQRLALGAPKQRVD